MDGSNITNDATAELQLAVGECILAWALVEALLSQVFAEVQRGLDASVSHAVLGAVRSFDARLKMISEAFNVRFPHPDQPPRTDWKLLYNYLSASNTQRNQVAHALMIGLGGDDPVLEPYFIVTAPKPHLRAKDVRDRTARFNELGDALTPWFVGELMDRRGARPPQWPRQVPDLVLRLRAEVDRNRAKPKRQRRPSHR